VPPRLSTAWILSAWPRRWSLAALGLVLFHLAFWLAGRHDGLWLPGLGLGIALVAWLGQAIVPLLALDLVLVSWLTAPERALAGHLVDTALLIVPMALSWWCYTEIAHGVDTLDDPRSATAFLIIVPGVFTVIGALGQALLWHAHEVRPGVEFWALASRLGLSRTLGILTVTPLLLVEATPWLRRAGFIAAPLKRPTLPPPERDHGWGEWIELGGLTLGNIVLTLALVIMQVSRGYPGWGLWGVSLLLVVWTSLRQGLRGGVVVSGAASLLGLIIATLVGAGAADFSPLQGNLLAQCSTAILVGASSSWIQAGEARYRRVVGHIPVLLYSVRLPQAILARLPGSGRPDTRDDRLAGGSNPGAAISAEAVVTLVSPASKQIFGVEPHALEGAFTRWTELVHPDDRELLLATLTQLCLQKQPISVEYRLTAAPAGVVNPGAAPRATWVRDTLAPHHTADGRLDGWDGVVENITEARALSHNLRRTSAMLHALVANLPTGVFFVQGPHGQPALVNSRARQLFGQREDVAAGIQQLSKVYRLHRPDGSEYPVDELPVVKALQHGITSMAKDIVVHRPDGRHVPLITWAAPVDLGGAGKPEAAVWVLEDLSAMGDRGVQHRLEADLQKTQRLELIGKLASGTVHDFNNMLTALLGMAAIARGGLPPEHPVHDDITRVIDIGVQASELAEQLLAFSKQQQAPRRTIEINALVANVLKMMKGAIPPAIEVRFEGSDHAAWVSADEVQLKQVLINLCFNARDAMTPGASGAASGVASGTPRGGTLTLRVGRAKADGRDLVGLTVADTGCGMDPATAARIFEPFFSTKQRGTGLGLAVVQQIVERFGGRMEVDTKPGAGTRMTVWLPAATPPVANVAAPAPVLAPA
jgi:signal transduction histidine kinase